jgi:hypothetical protein
MMLSASGLGKAAACMEERRKEEFAVAKDIRPVALLSTGSVRQVAPVRQVV